MSDVFSGIGHDAENVGNQAIGGLNQFAQMTQAYLAAVPPGIGLINFPVNPSEYTVTKTQQIKTSTQPSASDSGPMQYQGPDPRSLTVHIILDYSTDPTKSVDDDVLLLLSWLEPTIPSKLMGAPEPPVILFGWGQNTPFRGYITQANVQYKLFRQGTPVRAEIDVTMQLMSLNLVPTNPTSGGLAPRRTHVVVEGDTLASIAHAEYRRPTLWRAIAEANNIDDPTRLEIGRELIVPDRREARNLS